MPGATHREVKKPQISARDLADYMAAGTRERAKRRIIRDCKYRAISRIIQHDEAKTTISNFFLDENQNVAALFERAEWVRSKLADSDFEADLNPHNANRQKMAQKRKKAPARSKPEPGLSIAHKDRLQIQRRRQRVRMYSSPAGARGLSAKRFDAGIPQTTPGSTLAR